jgi:hypothetical protein
MTSFYTVHPFGDEWAWDPLTGGREPACCFTIDQATALAIEVKAEYCALADDSNWKTNFWSEVWWWPVKPDRHTSGKVVGYVTPDGTYVGGEPDVDEMGYLKV